MKKPQKLTVKKLMTISLLIALEIILTRILSIQTPIVRISFGFLPIVIMAMMYGPVYAGIGAVIANLVGVTLFPIAFFPGFILTAFLSGIVYGLVLYNRPKCMKRIVIAVLIVTVILQLGLDTLWIQILAVGTLSIEGYLALMPMRIVRTLIMAPIQIISIRTVTRQSVLGRFFYNASNNYEAMK